MRLRSIFAAVAFFLSLAILSGCVERALVITSEPTGAQVVVNQQWRGTTPFVVPFKHYGVYDIWIEHPGVEENGKMVKFYPLHVGEPVKAPGYQYAGADFVSEVLLPTTLRDQQNLHYVLERVEEADDVDDVLARAQQLREASQARTRMRYEKDLARGRYDIPAASEDDEDFVPIEDLPMGDIDATPPLPSEVPLYADPDNRYPPAGVPYPSYQEAQPYPGYQNYQGYQPAPQPYPQQGYGQGYPGYQGY